MGGTTALSFQPAAAVTALISCLHWLLSGATSQSWLELMIGRFDFIVWRRECGRNLLNSSVRLISHELSILSRYLSTQFSYFSPGVTAASRERQGLKLQSQVGKKNRKRHLKKKFSCIQAHGLQGLQSIFVSAARPVYISRAGFAISRRRLPYHER